MQTLKRIASGALGALMGASTLLSPALAVGLEDFKAFTTANTLIVVGADAATSDVVGGINIGAAVARHGASAKVTGTTVKPSSEGAEVSVTTSADLLTIEEHLGNVREVITGSQFDLLKSYQLTNDKGNTKVNQFLRLNNDTSTANHAKVRFVENKDGDITADYLTFKDGTVMFEYELEFEEGWESDINSDKKLEDYEDETMTVLGRDYQVVTATTDKSDSTAKEAVLTLISGAVQGTLAEGEKQTYTYAGNPYEISVVFISNPNSGSAKTILSVNGKNSKELADGETTSVSGITVGISNLLVNERGGVVTFFLGANKVVMKDTTITDDAFDGTVEVNNENIEDAVLKIKGSVTSTVMKLTDIRYQLKTDAKVSSDVYIPAGKTLSSQLDEPAGMLHDGWDIEYRGLMDTGVSVLKFDPSGDDEYNLRFTTNEGLEYNIDLLEDNSASASYKIGDADDALHWKEVVNISRNWASHANYSARGIAEDSHFVLTNSKGGREGGDETSFTHVLRYDSLDTTEKKVTFTDLATGAREITYKDTDFPKYLLTDGTSSSSGTAANASGWSDTLIVGGNTFRVFIENVTGSTRKLAIDLNGDNQFDVDVANDTAAGEGDRADIVIKGGGILVMPENDSTGAHADGMFFNLTTLNKEFDEQPGADEGVVVNITTPTTTTVDASVTGAVTMRTIKQDSDYKRGMTNYGVAVELFDPSSGSTAGTVTFEYPLSERGANVFVVGKGAATTTVPGSENVQFTELGTSITKLDSEVTTSDKAGKNIILVGGPFANKLVDELAVAGKTIMKDEWLTNPAYGPGFAIAQYLADAWGKPAIVVAGHTADDTRKASLALATTALTGSGVSWTGTTQAAFTYTAPKKEEAMAKTETTGTGA